MNLQVSVQLVLLSILLCMLTLSAGTGSVHLHSNVTFGVRICPTPTVEFTCTAINVPRLEWKKTDMSNSLELVTYNQDATPGHHHTPAPGFESKLTDVSREGSSPVANLTSTLIASFSVLMNGDQISCESIDDISDGITIQYSLRPPPPAPLFSHNFSSVRDGEVTLTLYWDETFTTTHAVERYCVRSEGIVCLQQCVESGTPFSCPGLVAGGEYIFWFRAINCGDQEGEESQPLVAHPQAPNDPLMFGMIATYDKTTNDLMKMEVEWMPVPESSITAKFTARNEYVITVRNSTEDLLVMNVTCDQSVDHDQSEAASCSATFMGLETEVDEFTVSISARNIVGESNTTFYPNTLFSSSSFYYDPTFSFVNCTTSVKCSSSLDLSDTTRCVVRYGTDPSYTLLSDPVDGPLNSMFQLPLLEPSTTYYFQTSVLINSSLTVQIQEEFSTGKFDKNLELWSSHFILVIVGVIMWVIALLMIISSTILLCFIRLNCKYCLFTVFLVASIILLIVSLVLWIFIAVYILQQKNTCDTQWKEVRNGMIIAAHVLSDITFLLSLITFIALVIISCRRRGKSTDGHITKKKAILKSRSPQPQPESDAIYDEIINLEPLETKRNGHLQPNREYSELDQSAIEGSCVFASNEYDRTIHGAPPKPIPNPDDPEYAHIVPQKKEKKKKNKKQDKNKRFDYKDHASLVHHVEYQHLDHGHGGQPLSSVQVALVPHDYDEPVSLSGSMDLRQASLVLKEL